jgi:hypothetical protein
MSVWLCTQKSSCDLHLLRSPLWCAWWMQPVLFLNTAGVPQNLHQWDPADWTSRHSPQSAAVLEVAIRGDSQWHSCMTQNISSLWEYFLVFSGGKESKAQKFQVWYIYIQWNLYEAEPHGTENIFHIGQVSALYKIATKKKLNPLKSYYLHGAYLFISQNRRRWLL